MAPTSPAMNPSHDTQGPELRRLWKQESLRPPRRDLELTQESWIERGGEVVGWWLACLEYWLSASGWLRAWLRLNLIVGLALGVAGMLLLPAAARVLEQLALSSGAAAQVAEDVFTVVRGLPPVVVSLAVVLLAWLVARRLLRGRRRPRRPYSEDYYE